MSRYSDYDHASWVQRQLNATIKDHPSTKRDRTLAAEGRGYYGAARVLAPDGGEPLLNEFHKKAFYILGIIAGGIYNAPIPWHLVHWRNTQIIVPWQWGDGFGTWDFDKMTMMWMLCHMARIRGYLGAPKGGRSTIEIFLSQRKDTGGMSERHPNMEQALDSFHSWFPSDSFLTYPGDRPFPLPVIKQAITKYHNALDTRQHGDVAAHACLDEIQAALGMPWVQGATIIADADSSKASSQPPP